MTLLHFIADPKPSFDSFYTERRKSLRIHTQRSACLTLNGSFKINDSKGEYAINYNAVDIYTSFLIWSEYIIIKLLAKAYKTFHFP
jgi:hypothetical protein